MPLNDRDILIAIARVRNRARMALQQSQQATVNFKLTARVPESVYPWSWYQIVCVASDIIMWAQYKEIVGGHIQYKEDMRLYSQPAFL